MHWLPSALLFLCAFAGVCIVYRSRLLSSSCLPTTINCGGSWVGEPVWCEPCGVPLGQRTRGAGHVPAGAGAHS